VSRFHSHSHNNHKDRQSTDNPKTISPQVPLPSHVAVVVDDLVKWPSWHAAHQGGGGAETCTASDAAEFSRRGARMTASPPSPLADSDRICSKANNNTNRLLEIWAKPKLRPLRASNDDEQATYTSADACGVCEERYGPCCFWMDGWTDA
jgi:hypothetical protein